TRRRRALPGVRNGHEWLLADSCKPGAQSLSQWRLARAHLDTATNAEQTRCERSATFTPLPLANVARLPMNSNIQPNHTLKRRERRVPRCGWECQDAPYPAPHRVTCHLSPVTFPIQTTRDWPWPDDTSPIIHALC